MAFFYYRKFPTFNLKITTDNNSIISVDFLLKDTILDNIKTESIQLHKVIEDQIDKYLENPAHRFVLPIVVKGSDFQKRVWELMLNIKPGYPISYKMVAEELATSPRAVGRACGSNHLPLFIPCHRVVSSSNELCGFVRGNDERYLAIKKWLLDHEAKIKAS